MCTHSTCQVPKPKLEFRYSKYHQSQRNLTTFSMKLYTSQRHSCMPGSNNRFQTCRSLASYPGSLGEGEKRAWYLLIAHALNYLTFQSFWISPGTSMLCWCHQPISRTLNFTLDKWIVRCCTLLNTSAVLLWLWKTNKQLASRPSMKERTYFSGCLQVLASQCAMKYCPSCLMTS